MRKGLPGREGRGSFQAAGTVLGGRRELSVLREQQLIGCGWCMGCLLAVRKCDPAPLFYTSIPE